MGGSDGAGQVVKANPGRGGAGIVFFAVLVFLGLLILGLLTGGG
jgi:hypothetical protein